MYPIIDPQSDLAYAVTLIYRVSSYSTDMFFPAAKRAFQYLKEKSDYDIIFVRHNDFILSGFYNAFLGNSLEDRIFYSLYFLWL